MLYYLLEGSKIEEESSNKVIKVMRGTENPASLDLNKSERNSSTSGKPLLPKEYCGI